MDEAMEVTTQEVTTPAEDVTDTTGTEPAETAAEGEAGETAEVTTPPTDDGASEAQDTAEDTTPTVTVPVKFRHESRELSMEEATTYAQMGLQYEAQQPMMDKLRMMAAGRGQSLSEFVDAWAAAEERAFMQATLEKTGGDKETAERLKRLEWEDRRKACEARVQQEQKAEDDEKAAVTSRLAAEFGELQTEFPDLDSIDKVPDAVINDAIKNNRHLLDAYLRHDRKETKKIEQNRAAQDAAAKASTGSQTDTPPAGGEDAATAAMMRGLRSVFG